MKYCSTCRGPLALSIPAGDDRLRHVCSECGEIHYINPKLIAGCLPVWSGLILMCRRAIHPRKGYWTIPAGFMEMKETVCEAAVREAREEAGIEVELQAPYTMLSLPDFSQVHVYYLAMMKSGDYCAGEESLEVRLFKESEIPWDEIAFETVRQTLRYYFEDLKTGGFPFRHQAVRV